MCVHTHRKRGEESSNARTLVTPAAVCVACSVMPADCARQHAADADCKRACWLLLSCCVQVGGLVLSQHGSCALALRIRVVAVHVVCARSGLLLCPPPPKPAPVPAAPHVPKVRAGLTSWRQTLAPSWGTAHPARLCLTARDTALLYSLRCTKKRRETKGSRTVPVWQSVALLLAAGLLLLAAAACDPTLTSDTTGNGGLDLSEAGQVLLAKLLEGHCSPSSSSC